MSGTASIGSRVKFHAPKPAIANTPIITSHRCRMAKERMPSIIIRRSFCQFRLHDETVPCCVHIAFQHAECDFHELRIALAEFYLADFKFLAVTDEDDGAILDGL